MQKTAQDATTSSRDGLQSPYSVRSSANVYLDYAFETVPGTRTLGDGAFGNVNISRRKDDHSVVVVIKRMRYSEDEKRNAQMDRALEKEITLLRLCEHPNILKYWGLSGAPGGEVSDLGIVTSYMKNGTLVKYLSNNKGADRHKLLRDVAAGLEYLHTPRRESPSSNNMITIVHGDIHNRNVLVTATGTAVLADFGLSKIAQVGALTSLSLRPDGIAVGVAKYVAPEVHNVPEIQEGWPATIKPEVQQHADYAGRRTVKADIFAFGMLVFDTFGGDAHALGSLKSATPTIVALIEGKRPARKDVVHPAFRETDWQLVRACWHGDAAGRPSIGDIRARL